MFEQWTQKQLDEALNLHAKWAQGEEGGEKLHLQNVSLKGLNIKHLELFGIRFDKVNFQGCEMSGTFFASCCFNNCIFLNTKLHSSNFDHCTLWNSSFINAKLKECDFNLCHVCRAAFDSCDLTLTNFQNCNLTHISTNEWTTPKNYFESISNICTNEQTIHGYGVAKLLEDDTPCIVKFKISPLAKRTNAGGRMCRASQAKVLELTTLDGEPLSPKAIACSTYDHDIILKPGEYVDDYSFVNDYWRSHTGVIRFFLTRTEAVCCAQRWLA